MEQIKPVSIKNFHCQCCGSNEFEILDNPAALVSEMGFSIHKHIYKCKKCGTEHIYCDECNGTGFIEDDNDYFDCEICRGFGLIKL